MELTKKLGNSDRISIYMYSKNFKRNKKLLYTIKNRRMICLNNNLTIRRLN